MKSLTQKNPKTERHGGRGRDGRHPPNLLLACRHRAQKLADPCLAGTRGLSQVAEKQMASPAHWATWACARDYRPGRINATHAAGSGKGAAIGKSREWG